MLGGTLVGTIAENKCGIGISSIFDTVFRYLPIFSHGIAVFNQFNLMLRGNVRRPRIDRYNDRKRYPTNFITDYLSEIV